MSDLSDFKRLVYEPEIARLKEQLEAMQAALTELLSWHPQLPQVREKVMHPQHQEAVERAEALVASNPASRSDDA